MERNMSIPLYIMPEHSEAYYIWHVAISRGQLPAQGNLLIHVDHHDDLENGTYFWDFTAPMETLADRRRFSDQALGIADFITPAMFEGVFDEMINFKSIFPYSAAPVKMQVHLTGKDTLDAGPFFPLLHAKHLDEPGSTYRLIEYRELSHSTVEVQKPCVLDIDLDYFCWDHSFSTAVPARMEISRGEYEAFCRDRFHPMRIFARKIAWAEEADGRYYLVMRSIGPARKPVRQVRIDERMDKFVSWLKENAIVPHVIDICRSNLSGYCPGDVCGYIEEGLLKRLSDLYKLKRMEYN